MKNALIIHGAYGSPEVNWIPWLKNELTALGYVVHVPQFPTPENQYLAAWNEVIEPLIPELNTESVIIGHSIGATFSLRLLEQLTQPIAIAALVAGFISDLPDADLNLINHSFYDHSFDWEHIRTHAHSKLLYHSHNDPYVPDNHAHELSSRLHQPITYVPNAGHFNIDSGYNEFPELLLNLQELIRS